VAAIRLEELRKHYKRGSEVIRALDGVTLDIDKGEFVAVAVSSSARRRDGC
jgi:putative ABC transport system ATP-binding protein